VREVYFVDSAGRRALVYARARVRTVSPLRPLLRLGGLTMRLRLYRYDDQQRRFACLGLVGDGRKRGCAVPFGGLGQLEASCAPRRTLVWGLLGRPRATPLYVETDRGPVAARVVVIDPRLQTQGARAAFLAIVPAGASPVALSYGAQRARVRALRAPAAADQCGYSTLISFDRPLSAR